MRLAVLTNGPAPYRIPIFEELAAQPAVDLQVFFDSASDAATRAFDLRFPFEDLAPAFALQRRSYQDEPDHAEHAAMRFGFRYLSRLAAFRPDVVISGEFGWRTLQAASYATWARIPLLIWWEGTWYTERHAGSLRRALRRVLSRRAQGLLGFGRESVAYLESVAPRDTPVEFIPQAVDNGRIAAEVDRHCAHRKALRASLGVRGTVLLCASRLLPHKGIGPLLDALDRLHRRTPPGAFTVLLAGSGPLCGRAERAAASMGDRLRVLGAVPPTDVPKLLAAADAVVFPTLRDCWGMVVNEALAAGLPVLGSRYAGASSELLTDEHLGLVFDPLEPASFDAALDAAVAECRWRDVPPQRLRAAVADHTCEAATAALLRASRQSLAVGVGGGGRVPRNVAK